ncbi:MAG: hypothetical protein ACSLE9_15095 [Burkholderiaceae bacterium]
MARSKTPAAEAIDAPLNPKALAKANAALTEMGKRSAEVAERFADGLPYDRERVVTEAKFLMSQSAEAMLEAGKRLIQIKENEPWGDFTAIVERQLGLNERTARVMMQAAIKYLSPALESKRQSIAVLGKSKLFDLMVESDEDLADLAEGGTIAGKTIDEMQAMTRRELQAALADARQTVEAKDKVLAKRDAKITALEEKLERDLSEEESALDALKTAVLNAQTALMQLGALAVELGEKAISENLRLVVVNDVEYLAQTFAEILVRAGIPVQFEEIVELSGAKRPGKTSGAKGA